MTEWLLLGFAATVTLACSVGVMVVRSTYDRLHYTGPAASLAALAMAAAVWVASPEEQARTKAALVFGLVFVINGVLSHATARVVRRRQGDHP